MRKAVIVDVDGTLADVPSIRHYVLSDPRRKNFDAFHTAASYVHPHQDVIDLIADQRALDRAIAIVTARAEWWCYRTATWLQK